MSKTATAARPTTARPSIWRAPFTASTWWRSAYLVVAGPVSIVALVAAIAHRPAGRPALNGRLAEVLRIVPAGSAVTNPVRSRVVGQAMLGIVLGAVALVITVYGWLLVLLNVAYPIRGASDLSDAWGGPSLAGAWAVHAAGGLFFLFVVPYVVEGLTALHRRMLVRAGLVRIA